MAQTQEKRWLQREVLCTDFKLVIFSQSSRPGRIGCLKSIGCSKQASKQATHIFFLAKFQSMGLASTPTQPRSAKKRFSFSVLGSCVLRSILRFCTLLLLTRLQPTPQQGDITTEGVSIKQVGRKDSPALASPAFAWSGCQALSLSRSLNFNFNPGLVGQR